MSIFPGVSPANAQACVFPEAPGLNRQPSTGSLRSDFHDAVPFDDIEPLVLALLSAAMLHHEQAAVRGSAPESTFVEVRAV